ncbi:helix-turn-helix domain-containing protein [Streptomyces sp. 891-h]|uniref:winged helix-turn-helix transcriptional regulator n=1 Tax=Streptomyces sp. 891-h TaxID=2720714 RepID=UPI001FAB2294|nr:helix-turn-helix domain-containing protein [Streptomyces sp. 891-h]UNZ17633.1 helix-turn-helix transcriptional regulator [Streptomyces sp. 891-h]
MPSHASTSERTTNAGRSRRSYDQFCAMARALDSVGDRWTLLIVRELLAGPRRYTDLHADLPGVSTDVLAARLKHMEGEGLAERRRQPRPASGYVYELTERGRALLPVLTALADWGAPALGKPRATDAVRAHWWALPLREAVRRALGHETAALVDVVLPEGAFHLRLGTGEIQDAPLYGEGPAPEGAQLRLELDAETCAALADGSLTLPDGVRTGTVRVAGVERLARAVTAAG